MHYILPADRQQFTFMRSLDDMVAPDHYVRLLDALVDSVISANPKSFLYKGQHNAGRRAFSPATMLKLYLYGYLNSIKSSRKLERETHRNIEVIWLLGNLTPDHKSISDYRKDNPDSIKFITKQFRHFLKDNGYIRGELVALDGTKVKANTNRDMLALKKIEDRLTGLDEKIEGYLQTLLENDRLEDLFEDETSNDDPDQPNHTNQRLLDKIAALTEQVENLKEQKRLLEEQSGNYLSPSDPDAQLMKSRDGKIPAYNVQSVVDEANQMIAHTEVFSNPEDVTLLEPMLDALAEKMQIVPEVAATDCGYHNIAQIESIEERQSTICYVPIPKHKSDCSEVTFTYDKDQNEYRCSEGKRLTLKQKNKPKKGQLCDVYQGIECKGCALRSKCTESKYGRMIYHYHNHEWRKQYRRRMASPIARQMMQIRKQIVEHPFGTIKYWMGKIPLLLRGKVGVTTEINIYATAYNFRRLLSIESFQDILEMIHQYDWKTA